MGAERSHERLSVVKERPMEHAMEQLAVDLWRERGQGPLGPRGPRGQVEAFPSPSLCL